MVYDPCAPHIPAEPVVHAAAAVHRHPVHRVLGRRVSRPHGPAVIADACFKTGQTLRKPAGLTSIIAPLFDPGMLTVAGMTAVGAAAFGGAILPNILGTSVIIPSHTGKPPHHPGHGGKGGPTPVPEPGSAAILAVAMAVVLIGAWLQGNRALRGQAQSTIASDPLPKRPWVRAANRGGQDKPAARAHAAGGVQGAAGMLAAK
jgi:hypothetical protein